MRQLTLVYGVWFQQGSHTNSITALKQVALKKNETFEKMLERVGVDPAQIWAVLPGHQYPLEDWGTL